MKLPIRSLIRSFSPGLCVVAAACFVPACSRNADVREGEQLTIGVAFETLQTEFWVAAMDAFETELAGRGIKMLQAVADGDANRQLDQVRNFITRRVDGIVIVPKDARSVIPAIRLANDASIPIVCFNRPPEASDTRSVSVVADNYALTTATVERLVALAREAGGKHKAMILIGDLGDINAIGRRDGFEDTANRHQDVIEVVARVPTEWNQEKAQAGVVNVLRAHPDISLIFSSSDFLLPSVIAALKASGKYHRAGEPGHVLLGSFDGDATAYRQLVEGYLDADGVQDVYFEVQASVQAILDLREGKEVPTRISDPGFVVDRDNLEASTPRIWGARKSK